MSKITVLSVAFLAAVGATLLTSDMSSAANMACSGHSPPADATCFGDSLCAVQNHCAPTPAAPTKHWEVTDGTASNTNHTIMVTGFRPNGGSFTCQACSATKEGFFGACTPNVSLNVVDADTQFTLGTVFVPSGGGMVISCDMSQFAWFDSVFGL